MSRYADWKAPKTDQSHLLWPAADALLRETRENAAALAKSDVLIGRTPLRELRSDLRRSVASDPAAPIVATGHQVELYHPGVWVKNVLVEIAAQKLGGLGLHVAVDTDSPKHLELRWPGAAMPISDDPRLLTAEWSGGVSAPTGQYVDQLQAAFNAAANDWSFTASAMPFFGTLFDAGGEALPAAIVEGARAVDRTLGIGDHQTVVLSSLLGTVGYRAFVHHVVANAEHFASVYNASLAAYRTEQNIRTPSRPMPDLQRSPGRVELPFWLDDLATGKRARAMAVWIDDAWALDAAEPFRFEPALDATAAADALGEYLRVANLRLSPRALTLTMFLRLFVVDQFVHGIGGGRYDQVSDRVIADFFSMPAPAFCVTTATLYFPTAGERIDLCVPCIRAEGHRLRHALLGQQKEAYLSTIAAAPRKSAARRVSYIEMHRGLAEAYEHSEAIPAWREKLSSVIEQAKVDEEIFDRELFYGIQPRDRLLGMIEQYRAAME